MRNYEFTAIYFADEELAANGVQYVAKQFEDAGVVITKQEDMGVKQLAYTIKKQEKGHYFYYEVQANPDSIQKLSDEFILSGKLLKFLFIVK